MRNLHLLKVQRSAWFQTEGNELNLKTLTGLSVVEKMMIVFIFALHLLTGSESKNMNDAGVPYAISNEAQPGMYSTGEFYFVNHFNCSIKTLLLFLSRFRG